jgi:hypothetical protein
VLEILMFVAAYFFVSTKESRSWYLENANSKA